MKVTYNGQEYILRECTKAKIEELLEEDLVIRALYDETYIIDTTQKGNYIISLSQIAAETSYTLNRVSKIASDLGMHLRWDTNNKYPRLNYKIQKIASWTV